MAEKTEKIIRCISCPEGCMIKVLYRGADFIIESIEGNGCKKGKKFAEKELKKPLRILTTTIGIKSDYKNRLPVRSGSPAPKDKIPEMIVKVKEIKVSTPVKVGDILAENFLDTGVDIIASETIDN
jgi:CxxC motif-containing protein